MALIYVTQKSRWSKKKGIKPYAAPSRKPNFKAPAIPHEKPFRREVQEVPSLVTLGYSCCAKKEDKKYTGDKMVGIGTMHKSNAVPIFSNDDAADIAHMRRN